MENKKIGTDIQQSKKFIELGIDVNTADMYWLNEPVDLTQTKYALFVVDRSDKHIDFFNSYAVAVEKGEIIPAWSLPALLGVIPKHIKNYNVLRIDISDNEFSIWYDEIGYGVNNDLPNITMESAVDACYEMVVRLKENGKL